MHALAVVLRDHDLAPAVTLQKCELDRFFIVLTACLKASTDANMGNFPLTKRSEMARETALLIRAADASEENLGNFTAVAATQASNTCGKFSPAICFGELRWRCRANHLVPLKPSQSARRKAKRKKSD